MTWDATTQYQASLGMTDHCRYRIARGKPINQILRPGDIVETSYSSGPYAVVQLSGPYLRGSTSKTEYPPHWSISMVDYRDGKPVRGRLTPHAWYNEIVPVDGRLLKLFENNDDELFVIGHDASIARALAPKPKQLELF